MSKANSPAGGATPPDVKALTRALAAPFDANEVKFKPQSVKGNRAMALAYVDARVIQDRLDEVLGSENWQDEYELLPDGSAVCRLQLRLGDEWITKMDVGSPSEQPDCGDQHKAAFSDALKRAAVKFGIGRYLYRIEAQWVDYDPQRRQFAQTPRLPASALPKPKPKPAPAVKAVPPAEDTPVPTGEVKPILASVPAPKLAAPPKPAAPKAKPAAAGKAPPNNGAELLRRLQDYDTKLAAEGLCAKGALIQHVAQAGVKAGHGADLSAWKEEAIALAVGETKAFEAAVRQQQRAEQKAVA